MSEENGKLKSKSILHLELEHMTFALTITGDVASNDCALAMLNQARRAIEKQQDAAAAPRVAVVQSGTIPPWMKGPRQ